MNVWRLLGCALGGLLGVVIIGAVAYFWIDGKASEQWPRARGVVTESRIEAKPGRKKTSYAPVVAYRYQVGNETRDASGVWITRRSFAVESDAQMVLAEYPIGKPVEVRYDPDDATRAVLVPGAHPQMWLGILVGVGVVLISLLGLHRVRVAAAREQAKQPQPIASEEGDDTALDVALVHRLEQRARQHPRRYRLQVALFGVLGHAYVGGVVLLLLGALAALLWLAWQEDGGRRYSVQGIVGITLLLATVVRALWVRLGAPTALVVPREQYPALFAFIDEVRRVVRGPHVHVVHVDQRLNAGVEQVPRFGVFGWQRNHLTLGLPLLFGLSRSQLAAVLGHEFGHLRGGDSRLGAWIYRVRETWQRIAKAMQEQRRAASALFVPFFRWYAPRFAAWSFVLAREQELTADRMATCASSARDHADALLRMHLVDAFLDHCYWPSISERADHVPEPTITPYRGMAAALHAPFEPELEQRWFAAALARETRADHTHPCPRERIAAMGETPRLPKPPRRSAADELLPESGAELADHFDADWREWVRNRWQEQYDTQQRKRERLRELTDNAARAPLGADEWYELGDLREDLEGAEAAIGEWRALLAQHPEHRMARYALGRVLLAQHDGEGLPLVLQVMDEDEDAVIPGSEIASRYLYAAGRHAEAEVIERRGQERQEERRLAEAERTRFWFDGRYEPHGLSAEQVEELARELRTFPEVKRATLLRRRCEHQPERAHFGLGVVRGEGWFAWLFGDVKRAEKDGELAQRLVDSLSLPIETRVFVLNSGSDRIKKVFRSFASRARILPAP